MSKKDVRTLYRRFSESLLGLGEKTQEIPVTHDEITEDTVEEFLMGLEEQTIEVIEPQIPAQFAQLNKFFHGQLDINDIAHIKDMDVTFDSYEAFFTPFNDSLIIPPNCGLLMLWQWAPTAPVFVLKMTPPVIKNKLCDFLPKNYLAKRMALVVTLNNTAAIHLVYVLTGVVTTDDPVHELIRRHGK